MSVLGGILLSPISKMGVLKYSDINNTDISSNGELYAGFVLLQEGTPIPEFVINPKNFFPQNVISVFYDSITQLRNDVSFLVYTLSEIPRGNHSLQCCIVKDHQENVYYVNQSFLNSNNELVASIWAQPDFLRPLPLWSSKSSENGGLFFNFEKISFQEKSAIRVKDNNYRVYHWIESDIFYTFSVDSITFVDIESELDYLVK